MRSWKHSGFSVDRSVRLHGSDRAAVDRIIQYIEKILRHCGLWIDPPPTRAPPTVQYTPAVQLELLYVAEDVEPYDDARYDASG